MTTQKLILFDDTSLIPSLKPFSYTRPIAAFRVGIDCIADKWKRMMQAEVSYHSQFHLSGKFPCHFTENCLLVNGAIFPNEALCQQIEQLPLYHALVQGDRVIALKLDALNARQHLGGQLVEQIAPIEWTGPLQVLEHLWDIFQKNSHFIHQDFEQLCHGRDSAPLPASNQLIGPADRLFIEEGASVEAAVINTNTGPVYIGKNAQVMEGCLIRGPLALNDHAVLKMGSKIYGATTLGPYCKAGGELNNVVMFGYSNKGHDGFLGNSVIGEWCNLGADTNNSNLKNNYGPVKVWDYSSNSLASSGLQFCGLFMGDHSKSGINTMFNTGTVVGVAANVFGAGFPPKFIPSFSWGAVESWDTFDSEKAIDVAERMMGRRNIELSEDDETMLYTIYHQSAPYRTWEKEKNNS